MDIEQHAYGDKKEAGKEISKGYYVTESLVTILRFGNGQACQKGTKGERQFHAVGKPGNGKAHNDNT
jgi:hypothetical protein